MLPPVHRKVDRPYANCVDVFDPQFRLFIDGRWVESPLAVLCEVYTTCRLNPQNVTSLLPLLRATLQQCNPSLLRMQDEILLNAFGSPLPESTNTR